MRATQRNIAILAATEAFLFGALFACLVFQFAQLAKTKTANSHLRTVTIQLKMLEAEGAISQKDRSAVEDNLRPLQFPFLSDPWPLRHIGYFAPGAVWLLLGAGFWKQRLKKRLKAADEELIPDTGIHEGYDRMSAR